MNCLGRPLCHQQAAIFDRARFWMAPECSDNAATRPDFSQAERTKTRRIFEKMDSSARPVCQPPGAICARARFLSPRPPTFHTRDCSARPVCGPQTTRCARERFGSQPDNSENAETSSDWPQWARQNKKGSIKQMFCRTMPAGTKR